MVVENIQRRTLTGLERALAYQKMIDDYGLTQAEVARRVGLTPSTISLTLQLLKPPTQREAERRERYRRRDEGQVVRGRPVDDSPAEILRRLRQAVDDGHSATFSPTQSRVLLEIFQRAGLAVREARAAAAAA